jgi:hypothetical protein
VVAVVDRVAALEHSEHRQANSDGERRHHRAERAPLSPCNRAPARGQVRELGLGWGRLLAGLTVAPRLGVAQVRAVKQECRVAAARLPLARAHAKPRLPPHPVRVDSERRHQFRQPLVELVVASEVDPLRLPHRLRDLQPLGRPTLERPNPLAPLNRTHELELAVRRGQRLGAQDEEESVGGIDARVVLLLVVGRPFGDVLPVDVGVLAGGDQRGVEPLDELAVATRVADERGHRGRRLRVQSSPRVPLQRPSHSATSLPSVDDHNSATADRPSATRPASTLDRLFLTEQESRLVTLIPFFGEPSGCGWRPRTARSGFHPPPA